MLARIALALAVSLLMGTAAFAQDDEEALFAKGQRHLALVIGNSDYDGDGKVDPFKPPPPGFLTDLKAPCNDARLIHDKLVAAGWKADTGKPDAEITLRCNLTPAQLAAEITAFWIKVDEAKGAKIVFYFSGHGAEVNGHKYLFGIGAGVDLDKARTDLMKSTSNTGFFKAVAFDLRDLLLKIGEQTDNGVLVVLDACRNDPLYATLNTYSGLRILAPSASADEYDGVIVTYATRHGAFAYTPPGRRYSVYSRELASHMQQGPKFADVVDYANSHTADITRKWEQPQKPIRYGSMHQPPPWCIGDCSQKEPQATPIEDDDETPAPAPAAPAATSGDRPVGVGSGGGGPGRFRYLATADQDAPAAAAPPAPPSSAAAAPSAAVAKKWGAAPRTIYDAQREVLKTLQAAKSAPPRSPESTLTEAQGSTNGIQFDIYWCADGPGSLRLAEQANALAEGLSALAKAAKGPEPMPAIMGVRTRELSPLANSRPNFRYSDNVVVYDAGDAGEIEIARQAARIPGVRVKPQAGGTRTPRYIGAYFCQAPIPASEKVKVYFQVPQKAMKPYAKELREEVLAALDGVGKSKDVDTEKQASPEQTEIRYYHLQDRDAVFTAAKVMERRLAHRIAVNFLAQYAATTKPGRMEIWIGRNETIPKAPSAGPAKAD